MIRIVRMRFHDIGFAVRISNQEKWSTPRADFERIMQLSPRGSFLALENHSRVGMVTTVSYGKDLAWIGNVIVSQQFRGKNIGHSLVQHAIKHLGSSGVKHIGLYCFANNVGFYKKLGFMKDDEFLRLRREPEAIHPIAQRKRKSITLEQLVEIDSQCFGANRSKLLRALMDSGKGTYFGFSHDRSAAFLVMKKYSDMYEFGPGAAIMASKAELVELLRLAISRAWRKPIESSCLAKNYDILQLLKKCGFQVINKGYRMFFNRRETVGNDRANYLLGFKDKG